MYRHALPVLLVALLFSPSMLGVLAESGVGGLELAGQLDAGGRLYLVASAPASITFMLLTRDFQVTLIPASRLAPMNCGNSARYGLAATVNGFKAGLDIVLPNGTTVNDLLYHVNYYVGCTTGIQVGDVSLRLEPQPAGTVTLYADVVVYLPLDYIGEYYEPSILYADDVVVVFDYLNKTHFKTVITLVNAYSPITTEGVVSKAWNLTWEFLVDARSWVAWLKTGDSYIPVGVLPVATFTNNVTYMLYSLYSSYRSQVEYYLEHPSELHLVVDRVKSLLEAGNNTGAQLELMRLAENPLPTFFQGAIEARYLGKAVTISLTNPVFGEEYKYQGIIEPGLIRWHVNQTLSKVLKDEIVEGIIEYALRGDKGRLEEVVSSHPDLVYSVKPSGEYNHTESQLLWAVAEPAPLVTGALSELQIVLPVAGLLSDLGDYEYGHLYIGIDKAPSIEENTTWSRIEEILETPGSKVVIAIDSQLASAWMMNTNASINIEERRSILQTLASGIISKYQSILLGIARGDPPEKAFTSFLEYLGNATVTTARILGGEAGASMFMQIAGISTGQQEAAETPGTTPPSETPRAPPSGAGPVPWYIPASLAIIAVAGALAFLYVKHGKSRR